jgi:hypothetical protein
MPDEGGLFFIKRGKRGSHIYGLKPPKENDNDWKARQKKIQKRRAQRKAAKRS